MRRLFKTTLLLALLAALVGFTDIGAVLEAHTGLPVKQAARAALSAAITGGYRAAEKVASAEPWDALYALGGAAAALVLVRLRLRFGRRELIDKTYYRILRNTISRYETWHAGVGGPFTVPAEAEARRRFTGTPDTRLADGTWRPPSAAGS
jgi:hypothetical protein